MDLDEQIKQAEKNKLIAEAKKAEAEAEKANSEQLKLNLEYEEAKKELTKKWWRKTKFRNQLITMIVGVSFLGFYINYVVIPSSNIENVKLNLQNQRAELWIFEAQQALKRDSNKLQEQIRITDSLNSKLLSVLTKYRRLDSSYAVLINESHQYVTLLDQSEKSKKSLVDSVKKTIAYINHLKSLIKTGRQEIDQIDSNLFEDCKINISTDLPAWMVDFQGAKVKVYPTGPKGAHQTFSMSSKTITIKLQRGRYNITLSMPGFADKTMKDIIVSDKKNELEFHMTPG